MMNTCPTDWVTIVTIVACLFAMMGVLVCFFLHLANKIDSIRDSLRGDIDSLRADVHNEMKDFHGRLCTLEEKYRIKSNP